MNQNTHGSNPIMVFESRIAIFWISKKQRVTNKVRFNFSIQAQKCIIMCKI